MTENKRFELCVDSNNRKSIWDNENNEGEPLLCLNRFNEMWGIDEVYDLLNALSDENEQLKNRVDELEDDNMKYTLSTDKLDEYTKRFMPTKCINEFRDCKTNRYYWLDNEDNFTGALELLNLLDCENEQLKQRINSRLHFYRELYDSTKDIIAKRVVEDLEDILKR